ncbi:C40 family peptidase [Silanimonas lenta]|jgi:cell wall-associated NlpC family hydrolase|uniref:C40 family peptidase n=1 Tax=Silanimonas lenta TaxID=265429 RepID=UPI00041A0238|nr:C40 family peptidase [Silanimonas lenta]
MTGRVDTIAHYPAAGGPAPNPEPRHRALPWWPPLLAALLLAACASVPGEGPASAGREARGEASTPRPLRSPRTSAPVPLDLRANDVLMQAMGLIGTRYRFGGSNPQQGFDCSGFTSWVFREAVGLALPRTAADQFAEVGTPVPRDALAAGDLVFFRQGRGRIDHVGIYVGEGRFVHAPSRGGRVRIDVLDEPHWQRSYRGAKRALDSRH